MILVVTNNNNNNNHINNRFRYANAVSCILYVILICLLQVYNIMTFSDCYMDDLQYITC